MRKYWLCFLMLLIMAPGASHAAGGRDVLAQVSTIDALMTGIYDGEATLASLREKGDFGLGTFNTLDGEMLLLDGQFYRITAAGTVERPDPGTKTPFAAVTFFDPDRTFPLEASIFGNLSRRPINSCRRSTSSMPSRSRGRSRWSGRGAWLARRSLTGRWMKW